MDTYEVPVICCYCGKQYATKKGFTSNEPTHGVCPTCYMTDPRLEEVRVALYDSNE